MYIQSENIKFEVNNYIVLFQSNVRSSLADVLSRHVFMDASGSFGRALIDLGSTHSVLLQDEAVLAGVTSDSSRVHPVAHAPGGTLLWHILESKGSSELENVTSGSLQVRGLVQSTFEKNRPMCHFQVSKTLTFKTRLSAKPFS